MDEETDELVALANRLLRVAEQRAAALPASSFSSVPDVDDEKLVEVARREIRKRKARSKFLPEEMFGEPQWNMLLDLFVADWERKPVATTSLCIASGAPSTTALRHLGLLIEQGFIHRLKTPRDNRYSLLVLSAEARSRLRSALAALV